MSGDVTYLRWVMAERVVEQAGLDHVRAGECLWCWPYGSPDHHGRYIDLDGLLTSEDPVAYALSCLQVGGRRPDAPLTCVEGSARPVPAIQWGASQEVIRSQRQDPNTYRSVTQCI